MALRSGEGAPHAEIPAPLLFGILLMGIVAGAAIIRNAFAGQRGRIAAVAYVIMTIGMILWLILSGRGPYFGVQIDS